MDRVPRHHDSPGFTVDPAFSQFTGPATPAGANPVNPQRPENASLGHPQRPANAPGPDPEPQQAVLVRRGLVLGPLSLRRPAIKLRQGPASQEIFASLLSQIRPPADLVRREPADPALVSDQAWRGRPKFSDSATVAIMPTRQGAPVTQEAGTLPGKPLIARVSTLDGEYGKSRHVVADFSQQALTQLEEIFMLPGETVATPDGSRLAYLVCAWDLLGALQNNNLHLVNQVAFDICQMGKTLDFRLPLGETPLQMAVRDNKLEFATSLLKYGACPDDVSFHAFAALGIAAGNGNTSIVEILLAGGARVNLRYAADNPETNSALMLAMHRDQMETAKQLLHAGASPTQLDSPTSPLTLAIQRGNDDMIRRLLAAGADPDFGGLAASTPLVSAIMKGSRSTVEQLFAAGAHIHADKVPNVLEALGHVIRRNDLPLLHCLFVHGLELDSGSRAGRMLLSLANQQINPQLLDCLRTFASSRETGRHVLLNANNVNQAGSKLVEQGKSIARNLC